jgi:hypothetical protein
MTLEPLPRLCRPRATQVRGSLQTVLRLGLREPAQEPHVEPKDAAALLRARRPTLRDGDLKTTVALGPPPPAGAGATHLQVPSHDDLCTPTPGEEHRAQLL